MNNPFKKYLLIALAATLAADVSQAQSTFTLKGRVVDASGAAVAGAEVTARALTSGREAVAQAQADGGFAFEDLPRGGYALIARQTGFGATREDIRLQNDLGDVELKLNPADLAQTIRVTAGFVLSSPQDLLRLGGSATILTAEQLTQSRVISTEEALRKAAGVHARNEDAFGLRPNIGIRGLTPTRSTKILLLEDGLPLSFAPYGDNASYYHPPIERFEAVEIMKGGEQILFGPMTVGGVINYVTPAIPARPSGMLTLMAGNRDYFNGHARFGGTWRGTGILVDGLRKQGEGSRDNTRHGVWDFNTKTLTALGSGQTLGLRFTTYGEDSQVTYSGLRQAEFDARPRGNPFLNDNFRIGRHAGAVTHTLAFTDGLILTTSGYASAFNRDWWRQSSNSGQRPNDSADPACGGMANLLTTCGNEGRLRSYVTWGLDPRFKANYAMGAGRGEADFGVRYHSEFQDRRQRNGPLPTSRTGTLVEDNVRTAKAASAFLQNRFVFGKLTVTPGLRLESVRYRRTNFLLNAGSGVAGATDLAQWIPGVSAAYTVANRLSFFTGLHRGFAPPRVEDIINNTTGASLDLDAELSWNYEAGLRYFARDDFRLEATYFRMAFENQIIPTSVAGGVGATLTNAGETLHQGWELSGAWNSRRLFPSRHALDLRAAWTWVPDARFAGRRLSSVGGFTTVSVTGNRLPYAPKGLLNASVGYSHASGFHAFLENVYTGRQFGDDLNTVGGTADGQRGVIPGNALWNAAVNVPVAAWRTTFFFTAKNLTNRLTIADRSRGILPGIPRLAQAGLRFTF
jgi:Fe(3+) dicitrate transport protein